MVSSDGMCLDGYQRHQRIYLALFTCVVAVVGVVVCVGCRRPAVAAVAVVAAVAAAGKKISNVMEHKSTE